MRRAIRASNEGIKHKCRLAQSQSLSNATCKNYSARKWTFSRNRALSTGASPTTSSQSNRRAAKVQEVSSSNSWGRVSLRLHQDAIDPSNVESGETPRSTDNAPQAEAGRAPSDSYVERISDRIEADPVTSLLQVNQEVQEEMAMALGKTGTDLKLALDNCRNLAEKFELRAAAFKEMPLSKQKDWKERARLRQAAADLNMAHREAEQRRIYLVVHRQSLGFTCKNHETVFKTFPLPRRITKKTFEQRFEFAFDDE